MSSQFAMTVMGYAEFFVWALLGLSLWRAKLGRQFKALGAYIALRVVSAPLLAAFLYGKVHHLPLFMLLYFMTFWVTFFANAALLYLVCLEVFKAVLGKFEGLVRLGVIAFRWVAFASLLLSFTTISVHRGWETINDFGFALMRTVSVLELCLLAFVCISMDALQLTWRTRGFGIALALGLMAGLDLVISLIPAKTPITAPIQLFYEAASLVVVLAWAGYLTLAEPAPQLVTKPVHPTFHRWNEIALALGKSASTPVAAPETSSGFFLTDVESVVDKVLSRKLKTEESKS